MHLWDADGEEIKVAHGVALLGCWAELSVACLSLLTCLIV